MLEILVQVLKQSLKIFWEQEKSLLLRANRTLGLLEKLRYKSPNSQLVQKTLPILKIAHNHHKFETRD